MGGSRKEIFTAQIFSLKLCLEVSYQMVGREPWKRELIRRLSTIHSYSEQRDDRRFSRELLNNRQRES
jgi:hypothetical protein